MTSLDKAIEQLRTVLGQYSRGYATSDDLFNAATTAVVTFDHGYKALLCGDEQVDKHARPMLTSVENIEKIISNKKK